MSTKPLDNENKVKIIKPDPGDIEPIIADWVINSIIIFQQKEVKK